MISQIFEKIHCTLQSMARSKIPQCGTFMMAEKITRMLILNQINYDFTFKDNTVYFEELDKDGKIVEVVGLDLDTGKYTVIDLEEYLKR